MEQEEVSLREKTISIEKIDNEYIVRIVKDAWESGSNQRDDYLDRAVELQESWRNLTTREPQGPWDNSANFRQKLVLKYGKATHARLWQLFSNPSGFYKAEARREPFKDREPQVKQFMDFVVESYSNGKTGARAEFDKFLWDNVFEGSGYLMCYWKREEHKYLEVVPTVEVTEKLVFDPQNLTGKPVTETKTIEKEVVKTEIVETPQIRRLHWEDIVMPTGAQDPQESDWVCRRVFMSDYDLKNKAQVGAFDKDAVEESLAFKESMFAQLDSANQMKTERADIDGTDPNNWYRDGHHVVYEWYGKAYVKKIVDENEEQADVGSLPQEIVAWIHKGSGKVLGWTYLYRISPSGMRPIFKADFVSFPDRTQGVGTAELIYEEQRYSEAIVNMRLDNGMLSSLPMFAYRQSSGLKPMSMRVKPGQGIPVDDVNDVRMLQFPFLQGFGYQEEAAIDAKAEGLLAISEINLGRAPDKVGALRNATGSNLLASESGIQLEIHFDRLARCVSKMLQFLFILCRERMPSELYYRVTGERGEPIFGKVNRNDLRGEFDFTISVDILGQSQLEKQQQATLMMQTLISPAFMQTGVVTPGNLYNLAKNFLRAHKSGRIDDYLTKPEGYVEVVTPAERLYRLSFGLWQNPDILATVRLDENHEEALAAYEQFKQSDLFGLLMPEAVSALNQLEMKHNQMLQAQMSGGNPNMTGMQVPRDGFTGIQAQLGGGGETLQSPMGVPNGPVV
jgi:hypothetical protein